LKTADEDISEDVYDDENYVAIPPRDEDIPAPEDDTDQKANSSTDGLEKAEIDEATGGGIQDEL